MSTNTFLGRSRSLRGPHPPNIQRTGPVQQTFASDSPSHVAIFLTNLRLLNLDKREDSPGIISVTFSTKDSQQSLKKRVQCVEWALFQLFMLWDPEETQNKLQPYFPPMDQLQSLNLRAALFRCLDHAKKSGVLGRDTVLRKTMLDECKGERLEEVLAIFSTMVVRKVLQGNPAASSAIVPRMAMEHLSYTGAKSMLSSLIMIHRGSLSTALTQRQELKARYSDFQNLLKLKKRQIDRRKEQLKEATEGITMLRTPSESQTEGLQKRMRDIWTGVPDWLENLLPETGSSREDPFLKSSFHAVWDHVEAGSIGEVEHKQHYGLLQQLDTRIQDQQRRLSKWQEFHEAIVKDKLATPSTEKPQSSTRPVKANEFGLEFSLHQDLQLSTTSAKTVTDAQSILTQEHSDFLQTLQKELDNVDKVESPANSLTPARPGYQGLRHSQHDSEPDDSALTVDIPNLVETSEDKTADRSPILFSETNIIASDSAHQVSSTAFDDGPGQHSSPIIASTAKSFSQSMRETRNITTMMPPPPPPHPEFHARSRPPTRTPSPLATGILATIAAASPSPTKPRHVLSLAERTRLSMSRVTSSHLHDTSDDAFPLPKLPTPSTIHADPQPEDRHATLIERARKSLANQATVAQEARIERRRFTRAAARTLRQSYKSQPSAQETADETGETPPGMDRMKLIEAQDADYDAVFKSRPKVKTSPESTPMKAWGDMGSWDGAQGIPSPDETEAYTFDTCKA